MPTTLITGASSGIGGELAKPEVVDEICHQLREHSMQVDTLVNDAGFGALGKFAELSADRQTDMLC